MFTNQRLIKMIMPLFMDQLLIILVTFLSNLMIAQAGANTLSGVSLVDMINTVMFFIFIALASGGSIVISQYIGSQNKSMAEHTAAQLYSFNMIISVSFSIILLIFHQAIIQFLFGLADPEVISTASLYFFISVFSYPFYSLYQSGNAIFRSIGNTRIPMFISILMNLIAFVGNALSIYVFDAGVLGFGISAILSRFIAAGLVFYLSMQENRGFQIQVRHLLSLNKEIIQRIIKIAIPNSIENSSVNFGKLILASVIAGFGTAQIAANGIANTILPLGISFGLATNLVIVTVIGQVVGANDFDQARFYIKKLLKWMSLMNAILMITITALSPFILKLFNLSEEISTMSFHLILIHNLFGLLLWPNAFGLPNALRAAGDSKYTMNISLIAMLVFRLGFTYILSIIFQWGVYGIWVAMIMDWLCRNVLYLTRYFSNKWTQYRLI